MGKHAVRVHEQVGSSLELGDARRVIEHLVKTYEGNARHVQVELEHFFTLSTAVDVVFGANAKRIQGENTDAFQTSRNDRVFERNDQHGHGSRHEARESRHSRFEAHEMFSRRVHVQQIDPSLNETLQREGVAVTRQETKEMILDAPYIVRIQHQDGVAAEHLARTVQRERQNVQYASLHLISGVDDYLSVVVSTQLRRERRILKYLLIQMYRSLGKVALYLMPPDWVIHHAAGKGNN